MNHKNITLLYKAKLCYLTLHYVISYYVISCYVILRYIILHEVALATLNQRHFIAWYPMAQAFHLTTQ